jgi:hypothetical protein
MINAPILRVNADYPEDVMHARDIVSIKGVFLEGMAFIGRGL